MIRPVVTACVPTPMVASTLFGVANEAGPSTGLCGGESAMGEEWWCTISCPAGTRWDVLAWPSSRCWKDIIRRAALGYA